MWSAGTMARRLTRQISPSAGMSPLPITNSNISAKIPCSIKHLKMTLSTARELISICKMRWIKITFEYAFALSLSICLAIAGSETIKKDCKDRHIFTKLLLFYSPFSNPPCLICGKFGWKKMIWNILGKMISHGKFKWKCTRGYHIKQTYPFSLIFLSMHQISDEPNRWKFLRKENGIKSLTENSFQENFGISYGFIFHKLTTTFNSKYFTFSIN